MANVIMDNVLKQMKQSQVKKVRNKMNSDSNKSISPHIFPENLANISIELGCENTIKMKMYLFKFINLIFFWKSTYFIKDSIKNLFERLLNFTIRKFHPKKYSYLFVTMHTIHSEGNGKIVFI